MVLPNELHYTLVLRAKNRIAGTTNNFTVALPVALPSFTQYYKIHLISASLPSPDTTLTGTSNSVQKHYYDHYDTGCIEVLADFGGRTNSYDTNKSSLQSFGFLGVPEPNYHLGCCVNFPHNPEHIVANPNFQNINIQLKDADGQPLLMVQTDNNDSTADTGRIDPLEGIFTFKFTPIRVPRS